MQTLLDFAQEFFAIREALEALKPKIEKSFTNTHDASEVENELLAAKDHFKQLLAKFPANSNLPTLFKDIIGDVKSNLDTQQAAITQNKAKIPTLENLKMHLQDCIDNIIYSFPGSFLLPDPFLLAQANFEENRDTKIISCRVYQGGLPSRH